MIAHFNSLCVEAIERRGGGGGMEGRREAVKAKILAENNVGKHSEYGFGEHGLNLRAQ